MKIEKEELEKLIFTDNLSYEEIGRFLGISGSGVRKRAKYLGIILPERRAKNKNETFNKGKVFSDSKTCKECKKVFTGKPNNTYCCMECFLKARKKTKIEKYNEFVETNGENAPQRANANMKWIKVFLLEEQENRCAICGMENEWNNKSLVFILDHIDGNAANNKKENFRLVCPNCDSQLDTYKSKNKNGSRSYYRYRK